MRNRFKKTFIAFLIGATTIQMAVPFAVSAKPESIAISGTSQYGIFGESNADIEVNREYDPAKETLYIDGKASISGVSFDYKLEGDRNHLTAEIPGSDKKISFYADGRSSGTYGNLEQDTIRSMNEILDHLKKVENGSEGEILTTKTYMTKKLFTSAVNRVLDSRLPNKKTVREFADELLKSQGKDTVSNILDNFTRDLPSEFPVSVELKGDMPVKIAFGSGDSEIVANFEGPDDATWESIKVVSGDKELFKATGTLKTE